MFFRRIYYYVCNQRFVVRAFVLVIFVNVLLFAYVKQSPNERDIETSSSSFKASINIVKDRKFIFNDPTQFQEDVVVNKTFLQHDSTKVTLLSKPKTTLTTTTTTTKPITMTATTTSTKNKPVTTTTTTTTTTTATTLPIEIHHSSKNVVSMETRRQGLIVDWWLDVCFKKTWNSRWLPIIPRFPERTTITSIAGELSYVMRRHFRRMYGYLKASSSGYHEIRLKSRDGAELILLDTAEKSIEIDRAGNKKNEIDRENFKNWKTLAYWNLTADNMKHQDKTISDTELYDGGIKKVWLNESKTYFLELIQVGLAYGIAQVLWKMPGSTSFQIIGDDNIWHNQHTSAKNTPSKLWEMNRPRPRYSVSEPENRRISFHKVLVFRLDNIRNSNFQCPPTNWYKRNVKLYEGRIFVDYTLVYPKSHFEYMGSGWPLNHLLMNESEAVDVATKTFEKMNSVHNNSLQLKAIVHVQHNIDSQFRRYREWWQTHYFVELDILNAGQLYRSSVFVHNSPSNEICFMIDYAWKPNVRINLLTPVRNQMGWLGYMAEMLQELVKATSETNINWIVIDYNSTDGDVATLLNSYNVPHEYLRVETNTSFNKVKCLNVGLNHVTADDSIVFVLDLHLQLPLNMFDRIRKLTIQGKTAFCPILLKFQCGEHEQYTPVKESLWIDDGYGMMAMYKSDWIKVEGFNEKLFGNKWGGEDWELVDRIVREGLFVVHNRMPRFYHLFHSNQKTWDGNHL